MSLKAYLQRLLSKIGVLSTLNQINQIDSVTGVANTPLQRDFSFVAPYSGYAAIHIKCDVAIANALVKGRTFTQITKSSEDVSSNLSVYVPCAKGDAVALAVLARGNGEIIFNFFPINNGK